jgi:hypothetical protein
LDKIAVASFVTISQFASGSIAVPFNANVEAV